MNHMPNLPHTSLPSQGQKRAASWQVHLMLWVMPSRAARRHQASSRAARRPGRGRCCWLRCRGRPDPCVTTRRRARLNAGKFLFINNEVSTSKYDEPCGAGWNQYQPPNSRPTHLACQPARSPWRSYVESK